MGVLKINTLYHCHICHICSLVNTRQKKKILYLCLVKLVFCSHFRYLRLAYKLFQQCNILFYKQTLKHLPRSINQRYVKASITSLFKNVHYIVFKRKAKTGLFNMGKKRLIVWMMVLCCFCKLK